MKYTTEISEDITKMYQADVPVAEIAQKYSVPEKSIIAKLSALGVYKRKTYLNKQGNPPMRKEEYIARIGKLLEIDQDLLESLEKVTKTALTLMEKRILALKGVSD